MVSGLCNPTFALLRLAFASAPHFLLNLARPHNSPVHSSIGTPLTLLLSGLRLLVNIRFQVLFHSPPGVLFTFPSRYSYTIGLTGVFSLAGWSRRIRAEFHVFRVTQDTATSRHASDTGLSPSKMPLSKGFSSQSKYDSAVLLHL